MTRSFHEPQKQARLGLALSVKPVRAELLLVELELFFFLALIFNTSDGNFSLESPSGSAPVTGSSEASDPTGCDGAREVGAETGVCHLFPRRRGRLPCTSLAPGTTAGDTYQHGWPHQSAVPPLMVHRSRRNPIPIPTQTVDEPGASRQQ
jgi:hypothetical protein